MIVPFVDKTVNRLLEPRMDQQRLVNPDAEPPYIDPNSLAAVEESWILQGVGPVEADVQRYFDWDQSCTDAGDRAKLYEAWRAFQELTDRASEQLRDLRSSLPNTPEDGGKTNPENRKFIFAHDPAYTQMFKARDTGLRNVQDAFSSITNGVRNVAARGGTPAVRFICSKNDQVKRVDRTSFCG